MSALKTFVYEKKKKKKKEVKKSTFSSFLHKNISKIVH